MTYQLLLPLMHTAAPKELLSFYAPTHGLTKFLSSILLNNSISSMRMIKVWDSLFERTPARFYESRWWVISVRSIFFLLMHEYVYISQIFFTHDITSADKQPKKILLCIGQMESTSKKEILLKWIDFHVSLNNKINLELELAKHK